MKKPAAALDPAKMTALLRSGVLAMAPVDIGLTSGAVPTVWGLMMELAEPGVAVSLVALADGSVSIYLSDGDGVIGCGLHPDVRAAAAKLLQTAEQAIDLCLPTDDYSMPAADQVRIYLLTTRGILLGMAGRSEMDEGAVGLAEVYYAAHGLIGIVELLGAGVNLIDEMSLAESSARGTDAVRELKSRGRGCRILPYVGNVARRSQN